MGITLVPCDGYYVLKISGFLDGHTAESGELLEYMAMEPKDFDGHYVLDLSAVEYVNSSMLGQFVRFLSSAQENQYQVLILNPPPSVENVLALTGLSAVLPLIDSESQIHEHLGRTGASVQGEGVDYDALSDEIESIIVRGEAPEDDESQLGRVLGR